MMIELVATSSLLLVLIMVMIIMIMIHIIIMMIIMIMIITTTVIVRKKYDNGNSEVMGVQDVDDVTGLRLVVKFSRSISRIIPGLTPNPQTNILS